MSTKLSNLPQGTIIGDEDLIYVVINGVSLKMTKSDFAASLGSTGADGHVGGVIEWTGTGLTFVSVQLYWRKNNQLFYSNGVERTSVTADPTNGRVDTFYGDNTGDWGIIEGTPAPTPVKPTVDDTETQVEISFTTIGAGATEPGDFTIDTIYDEFGTIAGGESDVVVSVNGTLNSTEQAESGTKSIKFAGAGVGDNATFVFNTQKDSNNLVSVSFGVYLETSHKNKFFVRLYNTSLTTQISDLVIVQDSTYGFNAFLLNQWQKVTIPASAFNMGILQYGSILMQNKKGGSTFFWDVVEIQEGNGGETIPSNIFARDVQTDTADFDNNLSRADDTVQKALDTIDDLALGSGTISPEDYTGTDTEKIQQALDDGSLTETSVVIPKKDGSNTPWDIEEALLLKSNTTITIDGAILKLTDDSRDNMFRTENVGFGITSGFATVSNVHILGLNGATLRGADDPRATGDAGKALAITDTINFAKSYGSDTGVGGQTQTGDWRNITVLFGYTENYSLKGLHFINSHMWGVSSEKCTGGRFSNLTCNLVAERTINAATQYVSNQDFIDFRMGCSDMIVDDVTGHSDDDTIACTVSGSGDLPGLYGTYEVTGNIYGGVQDDLHNVTIKNISTSTINSNIRILNEQGSNLYDITIQNITNTNTATTPTRAVVLIGHISILSDLGETYNINIDNIKNTYKPYCIDIDGSLSESNISNIIDLSSANTDHPIYVNPSGNGTRNVQISNVFKDNFSIDISGFIDGSTVKRSGLKVNKTSRNLQLYDELRDIDGLVVVTDTESPTDIKLFWSGTQVQYNALSTDANTVYLIVG